MDTYNIQFKVVAIVRVERKAKDMEDALEVGDKVSLRSLFAECVEVDEGDMETVGAWNNNTFVDLTLPKSGGLVLKNKETNKHVVTLLSLFGRGIAIWRQTK